ncbi:ATP-grasp domain-containing protein [Methanococcoides orientis]|uniref:ATP-grasp domain-containing protein n=1 Tax=Methanococcoides orientis TaxID=2822137 RepID=UPI001E406D13|nr:ATP-grasp domain-containing protein [Methanococcoides orientis]UGV40024.1 ATP-grasp domain-containing protein [Methanococcoides orientis]
MKILLSEYAVSTGMGGTYLLEGKAMLHTLASSFSRLGHEVIYTSSGPTIEYGTSIASSEDNINEILEEQAKDCDAALVIAPEELLAEITAIIDNNTLNLGCPFESVAICSDKLECTRELETASIPIPGTYSYDQEIPKDKRWVVKPRYGCASEDTFVCYDPKLKEGQVATEYIEGEHLSVSLICGKNTLPLTVNKQMIDIDPEKDGSSVDYCGCMTPYNTDRIQELYETAIKATRILNCNGYTGVDIILGDRPYIIDINPRPTTSLVGITKIMDREIAELLIANALGQTLPEINITGNYSFTKEELI